MDLIAGDLNGAIERRPCRPCGNGRKLTSIIEEAFADSDLRCHLAPHLCGAQVQCQSTITRCVSYPPEYLGLREKDQSYHQEVWMHLALANTAGTMHRGTSMIEAYTSKKDVLRTNSKKRSRAHGEQSVIRIRRNHPYEQYVLP